jgi:leucokinin receptor
LQENYFDSRKTEILSEYAVYYEIQWHVKGRLNMSDLRNLYSFLPENLTAAEIKYIENFRYNETDKHEILPVSPGIIALFVVLYGSISLIAVVGNLLVIVVVIYKKNMQTVTNVFIANLALADVAIGLFTIPFQFHAALLQRWVVADFMCKVAPFVKNLSVNISIFTLSVIAFDRYVAVMYPLRAGFRRQVAITVLIGIWVLSIVSSLPDALYYHIHVVIDPKSWTKIELCGVKWPSQCFATVYFSYLFLTQYIVPLSVISFSYIRVAFRIWGSKPPGNEIQRRDLIRSIHKKKVR